MLSLFKEKQPESFNTTLKIKYQQHMIWLFNFNNLREEVNTWEKTKKEFFFLIKYDLLVAGPDSIFLP